MPIYEFCCGSCQTRFEELVRSGDTNGAGIKCPTCGSGRINRLLSGFSFSSSGSGSRNTKNCGPCSKTSCAGCD